MSTSNATSASSSDYDDGLAFRFKLPREDLSLRAVDIIDGVPKFRFTAALKVPTITEEDVATCVRLCLDNKRPEFFYTDFPLGHPFHDNGRLFKQYQPNYLRDTSLGKLLAEVDWIMKCLHVGVRSDEKKETFQSWAKDSNLEGLATRVDFFEDLPSASVIMTVKSVDVDRSDDELFFTGEPKMRIDCVVDGRNSSYSNYITDIFDSVAYYDEPRFLKMKEIVKLILAVEWLKEKDVGFSRTWINKLTDKPRQTPQPIQVKVSDEEAQHVIQQLLKAANDESQKQLALPDIQSNALQLKEKKVLDTGFQLNMAGTFSDVSLDIPGTVQTQVRATFDDYDMLLEGLDPNAPLDFDFDSMEPIVPSVNSWNELFCETVPVPCTSLIFPDELEEAPVRITGGVSTSNISVKRESKSSCNAPEVHIRASSSRKLNKPSAIPTQKVVKAPSRDVSVKTKESCANSYLDRAGVMTTVGCTTGTTSSQSTRGGQLVEKTGSLKIRTDTIKRDKDGNQVGPTLRRYGEIPVPLPVPSCNPKGSPMDIGSGLSSMVRTPRGSPPQLQSPNAVTTTTPSPHVGSNLPLSPMQTSNDSLSQALAPDQLVGVNKSNPAASEDSGYVSDPPQTQFSNGRAPATPDQPVQLKDDDDFSIISDSSGIGSIAPVTPDQPVQLKDDDDFSIVSDSSGIGSIAPVTPDQPVQLKDDDDFSIVSDSSGIGSIAPVTPDQPVQLKDDDDFSIVSDSSGIGSIASDQMLEPMNDGNTLSRSDSNSTIHDEVDDFGRHGDFDETDEGKN